MSLLERPALQRNASMQRYMLLSAQKEAIQRRIELQLPYTASTAVLSPTLSCQLGYVGMYPTSTDPIPMIRTSAVPRATVDDFHTDETRKLYEINRQIVATLTELLNTDSSRSDDKQRAWIQERLLDAEQQIRRQRRRCSSHAERQVACSIAQNLEFGLQAARTWA